MTHPGPGSSALTGNTESISRLPSELSLTMGYEDLAVTEDGAVGRITLDKPPANVMDANTLEELADAFEALDTTERRAIVVAGQEGMFSAGVEVEDHIGDALDEMAELFDELFDTMRSLETVTVASVAGPAIGGGLEVVAGCDLAVASTEATFSQPEIKLATFPPIATALLPDIVGEKQAFELIMTGEEIDAGEAERMGLLNAVVEPEDLEDEVDRLVSSLTEKSAVALGMARQGFYETQDQASFADAVEVANQYLLDITRTPDGQEGLQAFVDERQPEWEH